MVGRWKILLLLLLLMNQWARAGSVEDEEAQEKISEKYRRGNFLIYDCYNQFYACVDKEGQQSCQKEREMGRGHEKRTFAAFKVFCAPLQEYKTQEECITMQKKRVNRNFNKPFCRKENI